MIGNALKFTYEGHVHIIVNFKNGLLTTKVLDSGIGITQEDLKKLFVFFGKIDASKNINKGGMGLGLTISKMIIE